MTTIGDKIRITAQWALAEGGVAQWVWHYQHTSGADQDNDDVLSSIEAQLRLAWDEIEAIVDNSTLGDTIELALFDAVLGQFDTVAELNMTNEDGTAVGEALPQGVAGIVKFFTAVGRSLGKKFVFGLFEGAQVDGLLTASAIIDLIAFALEFDDDVLSGAANLRPGNFNPVTGLFRAWSKAVGVNDVVGYQRRRKPGVGL